MITFPKKYANLIFLGIITLLTLSIYYPSLNNQFLNDWDDGIYVTNNPSLKSPEGGAIKNAFTTFSNGHYHPLTTLTYHVEYKLFGLDPKPYHVTNLILHILNSFLVFLFVNLLLQKNGVAFITALLFAVHPMHVETVAWISDRKDLLCSLFFIGGLCAYLLYKTNANRKFFWYTWLFFVLALFSKAMAITFPVVLLLLDHFMDKKLERKKVIEKTPFFILSLIFGYVSILSQRSGNALGDIAAVSLMDKILFSSYAVIMYVFKLFSFGDLSGFYNYPVIESGKYPLIFYLAPMLLLVLIGIVYKVNTMKKIVGFGFLFFLVTIALVLQILPAGNVIMADRYTYLPYIGLFLILAFFVNETIIKVNDHLLLRSIATLALSLYVVVCCYYSFNRTKIWRDSLTFWNDTIKKNPDAALPYSNRAAIFIREKQFEKAIDDLNHAISIRPKYVTARYNRGMAYLKTGKFDEAITDYSYVLENNPRDIIAVYLDRGTAYLNTGNYPKAAEDFTSALKYNSQLPPAYYYRGMAFHSGGRYTDAINDFSMLIKLDPKFPGAYYLRALSLQKTGDYKNALQDARTAQQMGYRMEKGFMEELTSKN